MKKIFLLMCCVTIISCENSIEYPDLVDGQSQVLPHFCSMEEVNSTISMLIGMDQDERKDWEKAHGYKSFHTKCEEVYATVRAIEFESQEEALAKVSEYSDYLQILEDDGELEVENVLYNSIYKYIIDENRVFHMDKMFYKVFDQVIVGTAESSLQKLCELEASEISSLNKDSSFEVMQISNLSYKKDVANDVGRGETDTSSKQKYDGRYRRVKLEVAVIRTQALGSTRIDYERIITPQQRISYIWWRYTVPNVSADMDARVDYEESPAGSGEWKNQQFTEILSENNSDRIFENDIVYQSVYEENLDYHFGAYDCNATTSHISNQAEVIENKYIL